MSGLQGLLPLLDHPPPPLISLSALLKFFHLPPVAATDPADWWCYCILDKCYLNPEWTNPCSPPTHPHACLGNKDRSTCPSSYNSWKRQPHSKACLFSSSTVTLAAPHSAYPKLLTQCTVKKLRSRRTRRMWPGNTGLAQWKSLSK